MNLNWSKLIQLGHNGFKWILRYPNGSQWISMDTNESQLIPVDPSSFQCIQMDHKGFQCIPMDPDVSQGPRDLGEYKSSEWLLGKLAIYDSLRFCKRCLKCWDLKPRTKKNVKSLCGCLPIDNWSRVQPVCAGKRL